MLYLKKANIEDMDQEYHFIKQTPYDENGFQNPYANTTFEKFANTALPKFLNYSNGHNLPEGYVPETTYFLWDNDYIVGLFRIRHFLNDVLKKGAGHIGYGISKAYRGKGYAS